jgi:hypothetical protein
MPRSSSEKARYHHEWYLRNRAKRKQQNQAHYLRTRIKRQKQIEFYTQMHWSRTLERQRQNDHKLKVAFVQAYGGCCECCGEKQLAFLTVDHINHDGQEHRKTLGRRGVYHDLRRRGWPKDAYRCLCMNCNFATRKGKTCPHQSLRLLIEAA